MTNSHAVSSRCVAASALALFAAAALAGSAEGRPAPFRGDVSFRAGDGAGSGSVVVSGSLKRWRGGRLVVERRSAGAWKKAGSRAIGRKPARKLKVAVTADAGSVLRVKARRGRSARVLGRVKVKAQNPAPDPDTIDAQPTRPAPPSATRTLTVKSAGSYGGSGTVISEPAGISCVADGDRCQGNFAAPGKVTLTAVADAGSYFSGWSQQYPRNSGACTGKQPSCTFSMKSERTVTANFTRPVTSGYPDCAGYGEVVPELGYSLCTHWRRERKEIHQANKISGGSVIWEAWINGSTFAEVGNRIQVSAKLTLRAEAPTRVGVGVNACSATNYNWCGERQSEKWFVLQAGTNQVEYSDSFVLPKMPTTSGFTLTDEVLASASSGGFNLGGCTNPTGACTMR